jgi:cold shock protein
MKGKVKFFNREKEFGFIIGDDGKDYFVHKSGLQDDVTIDTGDSVEFSVEKGDRGLKAVKVSKE